MKQFFKHSIVCRSLSFLGFPGGSDGKEPTCNAGGPVWPLGWEDPLEKGMATHSSILAWRVPWTEEPGGLQSIGLQRAGHDWVTHTFTFLLFFLKHLVSCYAYFCNHCIIGYLGGCLLLKINSPWFLLLYAPGGWIIWTTSRISLPSSCLLSPLVEDSDRGWQTGKEWGRGAIILVHSCWVSVIAVSLASATAW